jgi:hypothetical protein
MATTSNTTSTAVQALKYCLNVDEEGNVGRHGVDDEDEDDEHDFEFEFEIEAVFDVHEP